MVAGSHKKSFQLSTVEGFGGVRNVTAVPVADLQEAVISLGEMSRRYSRTQWVAGSSPTHNYIGLFDKVTQFLQLCNKSMICTCKKMPSLTNVFQILCKLYSVKQSYGKQ